MDSVQSFYTLAGTAVFLGFLHTVIGPDHYLPFVALGKARNWSSAHTLLVTFLCGLGHVLSSVILGFLGIVLGAGVGALESIEGTRADIVKWMLLVFGVCYMIYGVKFAMLGKVHMHEDGIVHSHGCVSAGHTHAAPIGKNAGFWILFIIFASGPCEVLIPLVMYPASEFNWLAVFAVALAFSFSTVGTMLLMVGGLLYGMRYMGNWTGKVERWNHTITGAVIAICAILMFVGL